VSDLVRLGLESARARDAASALWEERARLEHAVRRTAPYIARAKGSIVVHRPEPALLSEVLAKTVAPHYVATVRVCDTGLGALVVDGATIALGIRGVLAGGRGEPPALDAAGLSPAQRALAARLARGLVAASRDALAPRGLVIEEAPADEMPHGPLVAVRITFGSDDAAGDVTLLLPIAEAAAVTRPARHETIDPRVEEALGEVEIDVVAELGRVAMTLADIGSLAVGDVVRVRLPVDASARLRVGETVLLHGRPTTLGHQIAIAIERHGT
jgi:flagellar motor switch protein FliM